jgi:putative transposase
MQDQTHFHRRNLPHIYREKSTYFITFRLKGSIPFEKLKDLKDWRKNLEQAKTKDEKYEQESLFFDKYDSFLHNNKKIAYLKNPLIAKYVAEQIHKYDGKEYTLICYSIMPNHVHLVFSLLENSKSMDKIMHSIKRVSAYQSNRILKTTGAFWQSESYDHIVRNEDELWSIIKYTLYNPVKAKLVDDWHEWKFNYSKFEL